MCGAKPLYLCAAFILEEGLDLALLRRIAVSMGRAAAAAGVRVVTGDTKVVERGKGDGLYIATSGVGLIPPGVTIGPLRVRPGHAVLLSGDVGRHGIAIMAARQGLGFEPPIGSDLACLAPLVADLIAAGVTLHCLGEAAVPVCEAGGAFEILGLDHWYVANEERLVAFVPEPETARALAILRSHPGGAEAAVIGRVGAVAGPGRVLAETIGGVRVLDLPSGEQLPRIC